MRQRTITVLVPVLALFAAACASAPQGASPAPVPEAAAQSASPEAAPRVTPPAARDGAWRQVTQASELIGRWEGAVEVTIPASAEAGLPKSAIGVGISLDYDHGAPQVKATMRVDMARFLGDFARTDAARAQGVTQDMIWAMMEEQFSQQQGITVGGKYFLLGDISETPEQMLGPGSDVTLEINREAAKLRMVFREFISFGLGDEGFREIVLDKTPDALF
ncbi:MAG: hypothetical protein LBQ35_01555 [Spirochaetaceae bacterium]|jgi:hypothetical protein|nr:hypothetical protein [Spirochaetaceae bacterium]